MNRVLLGKPEHWLLLLGLMLALRVMGGRIMHVRQFVPFSLILLGLVVAVLGMVVWRYRPGDIVTRESFDDVVMPHGGREHDEV